MAMIVTQSRSETNLRDLSCTMLWDIIDLKLSTVNVGGILLKPLILKTLYSVNEFYCTDMQQLNQRIHSPIFQKLERHFIIQISA